MSSFNGLKKIAATDIQNSGRFYLGNQLDTGTAGQALVSAGPDEPARWDTHTGTIQPLTMGTDLSLASGNATFDGSIPDTINAAGHGFGSGGNGIDITGTVITTDNDGVTINNTGGTGAQNQVLKVPNTLTITDSAGSSVVYVGSSTQSITINDNDNQLNLIEGNGIRIISAGLNRTISVRPDEDTIDFDGSELAVLKVPNTLTIIDSAGSSVIFDGSSTESITINDNDNQLNLTAALPMVINNGGGLNREVELQYNAPTLGVGGGALEVLKVPNLLSFTGYATGNYDGSGSLSINLVDTDTTYQGGTGISINTATNPDTINCSSIPNTALQNSTISGVQLGSNLSTLTFYDSGGAFITSYNGAAPPTSVTLPASGSTYVGGKNITVDTTPNPDEIDLDDDLTGIDSITMTSSASAGATALTGNNYPAFGFQTPMTYFDLRSTTNIIPGGVLATVVQRTYKVASFNTSYTEYSSNFRKSFVAQSSNVMVEFRANVRADSKVFYGGLYDWNAGSWNTDQRNRFNFNDETDQDFTVLTWWMRNLTPGTTYYISPYFRGNGSPVYVYAGNSGTTDLFAPGIMRIYDGGNNVQIY